MTEFDFHVSRDGPHPTNPNLIYETKWKTRFAWFPRRVKHKETKKWVWLQPYEEKMRGYYGCDWSYQRRSV